MISPQMIRYLLQNTELNENDITKKIIIPCLLKISMTYGYNLREIVFTGGTQEKGNDIQYYELVGPDKHRFYTGIQVKVKNINQSDATGLILQGAQAFEKDILDTSTGLSYRTHRWIVATIGDISPHAKDEIRKELTRYGKLISFWDGIKISELILDHFYNEFIGIMKVDPVTAGSTNVVTQWWDPVNPPEISNSFNSEEWVELDMSGSTVGYCDGVFLTIAPLDSVSPPVKCMVRSSVDEIIIESFMSQISPSFLRLKQHDIKVEAKLLPESRPVKILNRGVRFIR